MGTAADHAFANVTPPRRGECLAIEVTTTAEAYDLTHLPLAGWAPKESKAREHVFVTLQAVGGDVWFYFAETDEVDLDETEIIEDGSQPTYADECGDRLIENATSRLRINRQRDRFLVVKAAAGDTGPTTLLLRASSESFGD